VPNECGADPRPTATNEAGNSAEDESSCFAEGKASGNQYDGTISQNPHE
jgi:hypothetical protein